MQWLPKMCNITEITGHSVSIIIFFCLLDEKIWNFMDKKFYFNRHFNFVLGEQDEMENFIAERKKKMIIMYLF